MKKNTYFIYLIIILFSSLFISSCQNIQEEVEADVEEIDQNTELSCFANRINYYNEAGELIKYSNRTHTQSQKLLSDSTFDASNSLISTENYTYDSQDRFLEIITFYPNGPLFSFSKVENTYNGNTKTLKVFAGISLSDLYLIREDFYIEDNLQRSVEYSFRGTITKEIVQTFVNGLLMRKEETAQGRLKVTTIFEYEGQKLIKTVASVDSGFGEDADIINKYYYENDILVKQEKYQFDSMFEYISFTKTNDTHTTEIYEALNNYLDKREILRYDSYDNVIYEKYEQMNIGSSEIYHTITYNQHGFITNHITERAEFIQGSPFGNSYLRIEYTDLQCY